MDPRHFFTKSRLLIVAGKGGVGKSAVSMGLAVAAARSGLRVLHVELDGKTGVKPQVEGLSHLSLSPGSALTEYLSSHGLGLISRRLEKSGVIDLVASTAPGIDDLLVLGKLKSLERGDSADVIIVDAPASGQAIDLLRSPTQLKRAVTAGPIRQQADEVLAMLADGSRCRVMLVTTPAYTPVSELAESAYTLEDDIGVSLTPVVLNGIAPPMDNIDIASVSGRAHSAVSYATQVRAAQHDAMAQLSSQLPLAQLHVGFHLSAGEALIEDIAVDLLDAIGEIAEKSGGMS